MTEKGGNNTKTKTPKDDEDTVKPDVAERAAIKREISTYPLAQTGTTNTSSDLSIPLPTSSTPNVETSSLPASSGHAPPTISRDALISMLARFPDVQESIRKGTLAIPPVAEESTHGFSTQTTSEVHVDAYSEGSLISKPYNPPKIVALSLGAITGQRDYLNLSVYGTPIESDASEIIPIKNAIKPVLYYFRDTTTGSSLPHKPLSLQFSPEREFLSAIVSDTHQFFDEQGGYIRLAISEHIWEKSGCASICGVPIYNAQHRVMTLTSVPSFIPRSQYVNGAIRMAIAIALEHSFLFINSSDNMHVDGASLSSYPQFSNICTSTRRQVITPVFPNPILLAKITPNQCLARNLDELVGLNVYKIGFGERVDVLDGIAFSDVYYANIDFMAAELIRLTNDEYDNAILDVGRFKEALLAFSAPGTVIDIDRVTYQRSKKVMLRPPQDALGRIIFALCAVPEFKPQIVALYQNFISESGVVKVTIDNAIKFGVENNPGGTNLTNLLNSKMSQFRHENMYSVLTYEILPDIYHLVTEQPPRTMDATNMCVTIFEVMMFFVLFPKAAFQIGYSLANTLMNIFRSMFPRRFNTFTTTIGWIYRRPGDVACTITESDYYIANVKPTIFYGGDACGTDAIFNRLASYIVPVGYPLQHTHAVEAGFPRLRDNPSTYIPYPRTNNCPYEPTALSTRITLIAEYVAFVLTEYSREGGLKTVTTAEAGVIKVWLQTLSQHIEAFASGMCAVGRVMAVTTNFYFTFKTDYNGNLASPMPADLAVIESREQMVTRTMRMSDPNADKVSVSTAIVFGLFYHAEFLGFQPTLGDQAPTEHIRYSLGDPIDIFTRSISIYRQMELVVIPFGVLSILTNPACETPGIRRLREILNTGWNNQGYRRPLITPAEGALFLAAIADLLSREKTYKLGRALDASGGNATRNMMFFSPAIRLYDAALEVLPVDATSPTVVRNNLSLLSVYDYRRILLCLDFVCDGTSPANKLVRGVVVRKTHVTVLDPNELADLTGFAQVNYSDQLFSSERRNDQNAVVLRYNGRSYDDPATFPKLAVSIPDLSTLDSQHLLLLALGVEEKTIALCFPNALFAYGIKTAPMASCMDDLSGFSVSSFVSNLSLSIVALTFHDTRPTNEYRYSAPSVYAINRYIYPANPLPTHDLIAAGIVPEASRNRGYFPISEQVVDTGTLANGIIASNGRPKTYRSKSFSNPIKAYRTNAELTRPPRVYVRTPALLTDP